MDGAETVAVRRRAGTDPDGRVLPYTTPIPPVTGCHVEPLTGAELIEVTGTSATSAVRVLLPITSGLDGECELNVRGDWFRIVGGAEPYLDDDPDLAGYELVCTRGGA